jgi:O-antigen ligase/polysaccharide polymerase Wzy-like membrane protein
MALVVSDTNDPYGSVRSSRAAQGGFIDGLRLSMLWLVGACSGFVMIEPAPYEFLILLAMILFVTSGMTLRRGHLPLLWLLIFYNIGFAISLVPVITLERTAAWTAISCFLSVTTLFFATVLAEDSSRRLDMLLRGYIVCAVITSIIAILAYFKLIPGWEMFIGALRARSTFKDPNVFGPFLILPGLIVLQRFMLGGLRGFVFNAVTAFLIAAALFLSFSRGAWGHFAASAGLMLFLTYITSGSNLQRMRILVGAVIGAVAVTAFILALLSLDQVADLFKERASLVQDYDAGHGGRFGRHILGALMIFDHPIGIGPLQFSKYLPEDPHNSFLNAFMAGGWLGGGTYLALILVMLLLGLRHVFVTRPWQGTYIAAYAAFVGEVGESYVIDVQHWRHYYLIMGIVWGLMVANQTTASEAVLPSDARSDPPPRPGSSRKAMAAS